MNHTYLITGYPGFISHYLILQLFENHSEAIETIYLLVLPQMKGRAEAELHKLCTDHSLEHNKFMIIEGDITLKGLALDQSVQVKLCQSVTHVYHLAAIYDLAVPEPIAHQVNVIGTDHVNQFVLMLDRLKRYTYFSTAYVSGERHGTIYEEELDKQQAFKNYYEKTKFEAELLVRELAHKVPTTIIRPGVVHGHSETGETNKFDGPYMMLNFFDRMRYVYFIPYLGKGEVEGNFVPVDYVTKATVYLSHHEVGQGKTYHLTHPRPFTMRQMYRLMSEEYISRSPSFTLPLGAVRFILSFSLMRKLFGVEREALDYFSVESHYDTTQAERDLQDTGISCPDIAVYIRPIVQYYKDNKHQKDKHIKIS